MKNLMVVNVQAEAKRGGDYLLKLVEAQIANSLELNWRKEDILIVSNRDFDYFGIKPCVLPLNDGCLRGSKLFAIAELHCRGMIQAEEIYWVHDLDAWQNHWFEPPQFKDIGIAEYSRPKFNGGSWFYRNQAYDIVAEVVHEIVQSQAPREEPTLNRVFRSDRFRHRVTTIDHTFNVGCSGFVERYQRSQKPVLVSHLHPTNRVAWDTHAGDRNRLGSVLMSEQLVKLLTAQFQVKATHREPVVLEN